MSQLQNTDPGAVSIEYGTKNTPAHGTMASAQAYLEQLARNEDIHIRPGPRLAARTRRGRGVPEDAPRLARRSGARLELDAPPMQAGIKLRWTH